MTYRHLALLGETGGRVDLDLWILVLPEPGRPSLTARSTTSAGPGRIIEKLAPAALLLN